MKKYWYILFTLLFLLTACNTTKVNKADDISPIDKNDKFQHPPFEKNMEILSYEYDHSEGWMVYNKNRKQIVVYHTDDKGAHWNLSNLPIKESYESNATKDNILISFHTNMPGWILLISDPSTGLMTKRLYKTAEDDNNWTFIKDISSLEGYVTGISFINKNVGWVTCTYHGKNPLPLYKTIDGGNSWTIQKIPVPVGFKYGNVYPPTFKNKLNGSLKIEWNGDNKNKTKLYKTNDGGDTWK